jgi:phage terminase small subunit
MLVHRGRRSIAELSVINGMHGANKAVRPDPPRHLEPEEATEWREIVASLPADYFANHSMAVLLEMLCGEMVASRFTDRLLADYHKGKPNTREYAQLLNMRLAGAKMILKLSRALGFLRPSTFNQSQRPSPHMVWDRQQ